MEEIRQPRTPGEAATQPTGYAWEQGVKRARLKYTPPPAKDRHGTALCLSGGGYRAALFHLGALTRLNELGVLSQVDTISSVSGGSIVSAFLVRGIGNDWPPSGKIPDWDRKVADPIRDFTTKNIRTLWAFDRMLPWHWRRSTIAVESLERHYRDEITRELVLANLPARPSYVFCATDMAFGVNWVSERGRVGDYQTGYREPPPDWPIARAVAASSCFPPAFDPLPIGLSPEELKNGRAALRPDRAKLIEGLRLTDGGVYDNLGLEPVWKTKKTVLVSDAGGTFDFAEDRGLIKRLGRYTSIIHNQAAAMRKRWLMANYLDGTLAGTYWGIGSAPWNYDRGAPGYSPELVDDYISEIRTDLDKFSDEERFILENHGYLLADIAIRKHAPALLDGHVPPPPKARHPTWMNEGEARTALKDSSKRQALGRWHWHFPPWRKTHIPPPVEAEPAATAETLDLLKLYRPAIRYDSQESYFADSAAELTDLVVPAAGGKPGRCNYLKRADGTVIAAAAPTGAQAQLNLDFLNADLYANDEHVERTDYLDTTAKEDEYVADAARLHVNPEYAHKMYGRPRHDSEGHLWLEYWFFYYYNDKAFAGIGLHEGDWEMVQFRIGRGDTPDQVTYAQHKYGSRASWSYVEQAEVDGEMAPVVYSGRGSHASYFRAGSYPLVVGFDFNDAKGTIERPDLIPISDDGPGWAQWPGYWGSTRARSPAESDSPRGPREHAQWWDPAAFHAAAHPAPDVAQGEHANAWLPAPPVPEVSARREGDRAVISYKVPPPAAGEPPATEILLTVNTKGDQRPPATYRFPVDGAGGEVKHPLPLGEGDYVVRASTVSKDKLASDTQEEPVGGGPG